MEVINNDEKNEEKAELRETKYLSYIMKEDLKMGR